MVNRFAIPRLVTIAQFQKSDQLNQDAVRSRVLLDESCQMASCLAVAGIANGFDSYHKFGVDGLHGNLNKDGPD
jgi:hypothetical protein